MRRKQQMAGNRVYSDEFKKDAVQLLETSGKTKASISREMGIPNGLLGRWQRRFKVNEETDTLELSDIEKLKAELRAVKRELEITRQERDILKKTVGIFSQDPR
jgi:transposase